MFRPIVICGPTASGKTALGIKMAKMLNGEIVSADSMQIYRGMDIGTAKPTLQERSEVTHHMIDVADIGDIYSAARYADEAAPIVDSLLASGKVPIICGGTGLYINALINGNNFAKNGDSDGTRKALAAEMEKVGPEVLLNRLAEIDPQYAAKLHINDKKRIIRALEVYAVTGMTLTDYNRSTKTDKPRYDAVFIGITPIKREVLYDRINPRVDSMIAQGLEKEVRGLLASGQFKGTASQAIGYKEMADYISGIISIDDAVETIKRKTRNYAKRQLTWFRHDERVNWIEYMPVDNIDVLCQKATAFIRACN